MTLVFVFIRLKVYSKSIKKDVIHNNKIFWKEIKRNKIVLERLSIRYSISATDVDAWFNQPSFIHLTKVTT